MKILEVTRLRGARRRGGDGHAHDAAALAAGHEQEGRHARLVAQRRRRAQALKLWQTVATSSTSRIPT